MLRGLLSGLRLHLKGGNVDMATKPGLYANIHAKRERIKAGSGEKMKKPGAAGAPTEKAFRESAKTANKPSKGGCKKCRS
jgi:hypothetical protein